MSRKNGVTVLSTSRSEIQAKYVIAGGACGLPRIAYREGASREGRHLPRTGSRFPILGIGFTPRTDGSVRLGPNAVLAFAREGYSFWTVNPAELWDALTYPGFFKLAAKYRRIGMGEMNRELVRGAYVRVSRRYIPELQPEDCFPGTEGVIHVRNAPSPAVTSSLAIARHVADTAETRFDLRPSDTGVAIGKHLRAVMTIAALIVLVRLPALLQSVAGNDEGLYALVAREWLNGHLPYTTVWEAKPPLFFAILAFAMAIFGKSMIAIRIVNDLAIAATATAIYAIGTTLRRDGETIGFTAACFYAAMTISDSGLSAVAESFYAPFIALAFAIVLAPTVAGRSNVARSLVLGVLLAAAVLVKESAAIEAAYAAGTIVWLWGIANALPLAGGFAGTLALAIAPYAVTGNVAAFWDANVGSILRRAPVTVTDVAPQTRIIGSQVQAFFPATLLAFGLPFVARAAGSEPGLRQAIVILCGWFVASIATVVSIREYLGNHFIGAMAPASLLAAIVLVWIARRFALRALVPATIALALVAHAGYQFVLAAPVALDRLRSGDATYGDPSAELAAYLRAHRAPNETLYVADDRTALYLLADAESPTRFAYSAHLIDPYQEMIAGVNGPAEIARILATRPSYVVRDNANLPHEDPRGAALLDAALTRDYRAVFTVSRRTIYERDAP